MSKFGSIKRRPKMSLKKFIEGAEDRSHIPKARKRTSTEGVLLVTSGRLETRTHLSRVLFYLKPELEDKLEQYCSGSKQSIITYFIEKGLEKLIEEGKVVVYESS